MPLWFSEKDLLAHSKEAYSNGLNNERLQIPFFKLLLSSQATNKKVFDRLKESYKDGQNVKLRLEQQKEKQKLLRDMYRKSKIKDRAKDKELEI
jgi:hypothetical protein